MCRYIGNPEELGVLSQILGLGMQTLVCCYQRRLKMMRQRYIQPVVDRNPCLYCYVPSRWQQKRGRICVHRYSQESSEERLAFCSAQLAPLDALPECVRNFGVQQLWRC